MPFYYQIGASTAEGKRTIAGLLRLRAQLDKEIPQRTLWDTLLLATWNIREFDSAKFGARADEPLYYIAEILSRFDLVAVQEVNADLQALERVQRILGGWWKYIVTDVTEGSSGNRERLAFLYDNRKVRFGGLAGELVLPLRKGKKKSELVSQFARTPFICSFKAGWAKFALCTVHIYYGTAKADDPRRLEEIRLLAKFLEKRAKLPNTKTEPYENLILLGDFNIFRREDVTFQALTEAGFGVPKGLTKLPGTNIDKSKCYDQIAFIDRPNKLLGTGKAGVFDFYESVYRKNEAGKYKKAMGRYKSDYKTWRTHQMSDHLPMWVELQIEFGKDYLEALDQKRSSSRTASRASRRGKAAATGKRSRSARRR